MGRVLDRLFLLGRPICRFGPQSRHGQKRQDREVPIVLVNHGIRSIRRQPNVIGMRNRAPLPSAIRNVNGTPLSIADSTCFRVMHTYFGPNRTDLQAVFGEALAIAAVKEWIFADLELHTRCGTKAFSGDGCELGGDGWRLLWVTVGYCRLPFGYREVSADRHSNRVRIGKFNAKTQRRKGRRERQKRLEQENQDH